MKTGKHSSSRGLISEINKLVNTTTAGFQPNGNSDIRCIFLNTLEPLNPFWIHVECDVKLTELVLCQNKTNPKPFSLSDIYGDDEENPYAMKTAGMFICEGKKYISSVFLCDGERHCQNGEDESHCSCNKSSNLFMLYQKNFRGNCTTYLTTHISGFGQLCILL